MLSVQDTAGALEQVKALFNPYVEGFAQLVQQQVLLMSAVDCLLSLFFFLLSTNVSDDNVEQSGLYF